MELCEIAKVVRNHKQGNMEFIDPVSGRIQRKSGGWNSFFATLKIIRIPPTECDQSLTNFAHKNADNYENDTKYR